MPSVRLDEIVQKVSINHPEPNKVTRLVVIQIVGDYDTAFLLVECTAPDNYHPDQSFTVRRGAVLPTEYPTAEEANVAIRRVMHYVACHEADEVYEYEGRVVFQPHSDWRPTEYP